MSMSIAGAGLASSLASSLIQTGGQIGSTLIQANYNRQEAERQRKFEERMSNTAIQRQIADAQKAGLSPSLFIGGQNASTPMGASANIQKPNIDMANGVNALLKYIRQDRAMDMKERMNERKLDTYENTNTNFVPKSFDTKDLKFANVDLDKVKLY